MGMVKKSTVLLFPLIYIIAWNIIVRYNVPSLFYTVSSGATEQVSIGLPSASVSPKTKVEVTHWRYRVLPLYWSEIGDLSPYHRLFTGIYFLYILFLTYRGVNGRNMGTFKLKQLISLEALKKYWMIFGILAFLTTSLSFYESFMLDLFLLVYYCGYVLGIPIGFISIAVLVSKRFKRT